MVIVVALLERDMDHSVRRKTEAASQGHKNMTLAVRVGLRGDALPLLAKISSKGYNSNVRKTMTTKGWTAFLPCNEGRWKAHYLHTHEQALE
jgi:hypothetical protein